MLFKRRNEETFAERFRLAVWPRRNHARSTRYVVKRVMRIKATPHAVAAGVAAGCFASFTPFIGFHFILAIVFAMLMRGSVLAACLGTAVGNPLTFPAIWAMTLSMGRWVMGMNGGASGESFGRTFRDNGLMAVWEPFILPMTLGGAIIGSIVAAALYTIARFAVNAFQEARRAKRRTIANDNTCCPPEVDEHDLPGEPDAPTSERKSV